ncbi:unnamed protein product [Rhodiola kirilowii]
MTRSSRHKSKRSAKDAREYSDTEEDVSKGKHRERRDEGGSSRGCKESGEKRKLAKDSSDHLNGYSSEEYVSSKKRKERSDRLGSDRWNGSGEVRSIESEIREESSQFDEKLLKSRGSIELKSKAGNGRPDVEKKEETVGSFTGKEESRSGKVESKRRSEKDRYEKEKVDKDLRRKDDHNDALDSKRDHNDALDSKRDHNEQKVMKAAESKDRALEDDYRKHESEKERERRKRKKADEFDDKGKYQERMRDSSDVNSKSRHERDKDRKDRDERDRDISSRDKHHDYYDRDNIVRDGEKRGVPDRERTQKNDDYRDDRSSRDHIGNPSDFKYGRDETGSLDGRHKKSKTDNSNSDSSVMYNDQKSRYKDYKECRKSIDKEDYDEMRPQGAKEHLESDKKSAATRENIVSDRERSRSFHTDYDKEGNGSGVSDRALSSRSIDRSAQIGDRNNIADLSSERHRNIDRHASEKSFFSSSSERRRHSRTGDRRSHDYEDAGHRNSGYKDPNHQTYDGNRSQDMQSEAYSTHDGSQVDGDNLPVSSSITRSARMPDSSRSLLPPPSLLKHDNLYAFGSSEEDGRGKLNNRPKWHVESNMGRMRGNAWRGVPNWPSPMGNGFLPFPHGTPTAGFHPMMQQFPPQMFGVRPSMDHTGVPYQCGPFGWPNPVDETCPSPMQNWDSNNMVPGEGYMQGRVGWDQNKNLMTSDRREPSVDRYKGSNSGTVESPSGSQRAIAEPVEGFSSQSNHQLKSELCHSDYQDDSAGNYNLLGSKVSSDMAASVKEISIGKVSGKKKNVDNDFHCSCVYLSKIDISADLADSNIFDQCVSLLGMKQNAPADTRTSKFSMEEESVVEYASTTIYTYNSRVPVFAALGGSLLEKAISLYRQQRDDIVATSLTIQSNRNQVFTSPEVQDLDPTCSIDVKISLASPQLCESNDTEPACPPPLSEFPTSNNFEDKAARSSITCQNLKALSSPTSNDNLDEDDENNTEIHTNPISTATEIKDEVSPVSASENTAGVEIPDSYTVEKSNTHVAGEMSQSPNAATTTRYPDGTLKAQSPVEEDDGDDGGKATTGDLTLPPTTKVVVPSEGFEDRMRSTEVGKFGSLNVSRNHQSPESTH